MKLKIALATATALGLCMGTAWAGSGNETYVEQQGANNSASIDQSQGSDNNAGSAVLNIRQVRELANTSPGLSNTLTIIQSGDGNKIGLEANSNVFGEDGVYQNIGYAYVTSTSYAGQNVMNITQASVNNVVGAASQLSHTHMGGNTLTVSQGGIGSNKIGSVTQFRTQTTRNVADITQNGQNNTIENIQQYVRNAGSNPNLIDVNMSGEDNGNGPWTSGGAAELSGAQSSALIQGDNPLGRDARNDSIMLSVSGSHNEFGVSQYGDDNTVGSLKISGSNNELGVYQDGTDNMLILSEISGAYNELGVKQQGSYNDAIISVSGSFNGAAFSAGVAGQLASDNGLTSGLIEQDNISSPIIGNFALLTVSTDSNAFALKQQGDNNSITGTVDGGNANQVAVLQVGSNNTTSFSQSGGGNNMAISQ